MAEQGQTPALSPDYIPAQSQQTGDAPRAPQSAHEAEAPRIERRAPKPAPRPITDWASI